MTWNHRVIKEILSNGEEWYVVKEVYYNEDGSIYAYTIEPVKIQGESIEAIKETCNRILRCLEREILIEGEIEIVDNEEY